MQVAESGGEAQVGRPTITKDDVGSRRWMEVLGGSIEAQAQNQVMAGGST